MTAVGKYSVSHETLGAGSFGAVYRGVDTSVDPPLPVAVKHLTLIFEAESDARQVYREMHILRQLDHPCVIRLLGAVCLKVGSQEEGRRLLDELAADVVGSLSSWHSNSPPTPMIRDFMSSDLWLSFELVDGSDLKKMFASSRFFNEGVIKSILYQCLCGVNYLHSANVVHRDLKPANILVSIPYWTFGTGLPVVVKIADFGLSRVVRRGDVQGDVVQGSRTADWTEKEGSPPSPPPLPSTFRPYAIPAPRSVEGSETDGTPPPPPPPPPRPPLPLRDRVLPPASMRRSYTRHVVTRWYRAPEVILCLPYTGLVDVWSLGCIFAELLGMMQESTPDPTLRKVMFPGAACGDLSGQNAPAHLRRQNARDQLGVILSTLGTPLPQDLPREPDARAFVLGYPHAAPINLSSLFSAADDDAISLLKGLLCFNPDRRLSVSGALEHAYFSCVRMPELETEAVTPMSCDRESESESPRVLLTNIVREVMHYLPA